MTATVVTAVLQAGQSGPDPTQFTAQRVVWAIVTLAVAFLLARLVSGVLSALADRFAQQRFRVTLLIPVVKFAIYGVSLFFVVKWLLNLTNTQLVAFSGLLGAALGLGLKDFLADIVGGLVVVVEQPYQVGDKISLGGHYGEVVDIGIRSTRLITPNDTMVVVPNFVFFNESIANANTSEAEMLVVVEFYVDPDVSVDRARDIVEEAMMTSPYVYVSDDHPCFVVVEDDLYYRTITGKAYVNDLRNEQSYRTDVSERVLAAFDDEGIESPKVPAGVDSPGGEN